MTSKSRSSPCLETESPIPAEQAFPCGSPSSFPACPLPKVPACHQKTAQPAEASCCCKASMADALCLLCDPALAALVDFDAFFFLTGHLTIGGSLTIPTADSTDNIAAMAAAFRRFSPRCCDLLDLAGTAYFSSPAAAPVTAMEAIDQLSLCAVQAVAFQLTPAETNTASLTPYQQAVRAIRRAIRDKGGSIQACDAREALHSCHNCCCNAGILTELSTRNISRLATLTIGPLVLRNVTVLGSVGSVLVLANETIGRFYLVCADSVEVLG